jgi:hypothetical protein
MAPEAALVAEAASVEDVAPAEEASDAMGAAAGGGAESAAGAGASVLLPQALRTNAAAIALIASLVFIYRYPENIWL